MAAIVVLLLLLRSPQAAVPDSQTVRGSVRDQTGAVLPGAVVHLHDEAGAVLRSVVTDGTGNYAIDRVPQGNYTLTIGFDGFKPATVTVRVAARRAPAPQIVVLDLATQTQEVTVDIGTDVVAAAANRNRDAVVMDDKELKNLPIFDRDIVGTLSRFLDASAMGTGGATLIVDGIEARKVGVAPSAIQQVKINQDPYSSEFPRPGRGRIEVITKPGADNYSGSMDFTFRDAQLNARDPFAETRPPEQRRIYEGVLGGPIGNGKSTSFLATIERREENVQSVVFAQGPDGLIQANVPQPDRRMELSTSVNHQMGRRHNLSLRFTSETSNRRNSGIGGTTLAEAGLDDRGHEAQLVFGARSVLGGGRWLNELRVLAGREGGSTVSLHPGRRLVVLDAFTSGGAQADQATTEDHVQLAEALTYVHGRHLVKAGVQIPDFSRRGFDDRSNRDGTFTFSSLQDYALGQPLSFTQQQGDGTLRFLQKVFGAFIEDQISVSDRLSITPGLRYDWQNIFTDNNNAAPRVSAAYAIDSKTALRGGGGVFYDRAGDGPIRDVLRSREERLIRVILLDPGYPDPLGAGKASAPVRSIVTLSPDIRIPYTAQYGFGVERIVRKGTTVAISYLGSRGVDLFRSRDVNAPPPPLYLVRPDPTLGQVRQIESTGRQTAHSIQIIGRGSLAPRLKGSVQYTFGSARNDTHGINSLPANNYDLPSEWGLASFDQRHRLETLLRFAIGRWADFGASLSLGSGRPYSLLTGRDDYHTGQTNSRPQGVGRNTLQGPRYARLDLRWSHEFTLGSGKGDDAPAWTVGLDAFNVVNHVNYAGFIGTETSPFFGRAIAAQPPRRLQLSAGFHF